MATMEMMVSRLSAGLKGFAPSFIVAPLGFVNRVAAFRSIFYYGRFLRDFYA
jgi:hypothetical protein